VVNASLVLLVEVSQTGVVFVTVVLVVFGPVDVLSLVLVVVVVDAVVVSSIEVLVAFADVFSTVFVLMVLDAVVVSNVVVVFIVTSLSPIAVVFPAIVLVG